MVTARAESEEFEGKEKFSFTTITKRFKFARKVEVTDEKNPWPQPKASFRLNKFFRRKKKDAIVKFDSGLGEFMTTLGIFSELSQHQLTCELLSIQQKTEQF